MVKRHVDKIWLHANSQSVTAVHRKTSMQQPMEDQLRKQICGTPWWLLLDKLIFQIKRFSGQSQTHQSHHMKDMLPSACRLAALWCPCASAVFLPPVCFPVQECRLHLMLFVQPLIFKLFYHDLFLILFSPLYLWRCPRGLCAFEDISTCHIHQQMVPLKYRMSFLSVLGRNEHLLKQDTKCSKTSYCKHVEKHWCELLAASPALQATPVKHTEKMMVITCNKRLAATWWRWLQ